MQHRIANCRYTIIFIFIVTTIHIYKCMYIYMHMCIYIYIHRHIYKYKCVSPPYRTSSTSLLSNHAHWKPKLTAAKAKHKKQQHWSALTCEVSLKNHGKSWEFQIWWEIYNGLESNTLEYWNWRVPHVQIKSACT